MSKNWNQCKLGDVAKWSSGGTPSRSNPTYYKGNIPWIKSGELKNKFVLDTEEKISEKAIKESSAKLFPKESIAIAMYGATIGDTSILGIESATNQAVAVAVVDRNILTPEFLYYFLKSQKDNFVKLGQGGAQPNISQTVLKEYSFAYPSIDEQKKIVNKIETLFSQIDSGTEDLKKTQQRLILYKQSVLDSAIQGKLVSQDQKDESGAALLEKILIARKQEYAGKGIYKEPTKPKENVFGNLPKNWAIASLEQITSSNRVICYGILMPKENVSNGVLYVKVRDMRGDVINLDSLQKTSKDIAKKYSRSSLKEGDLLLSIRGTYGRLAHIPKELDGGNITQDSARISLSKLIDPKYAAWCIRSPKIQSYFKDVARGVAVKGVNISDVKPTPIPIPPLNEQKRISKWIETSLAELSSLEKLVSSNLEKLQQLKQSVLKSAFEGTLT